MLKHWQISLFVIFLLSVSTISSSFADQKILSPRQQIQNGVSSHDVVCSDIMALIRNLHTNSVACVKILTADKLLDRGWDLIKNPSYNMTIGINNSQTTPFLEVSRDFSKIEYYNTFSQDKLSSYPELIYAITIADLDSHHYIVWSKLTGCDNHVCEETTPSLTYYNPAINEDEARKMITDLGFQLVYGQPTYVLHLLYENKTYTIALMGL